MSDATATNDNILWTVTYGAVFKARQGKAMKLMIVVRSRSGKWSAPTEMTDERGDYKDLGVDQFTFTQVSLRGKAMRCKDVSTVTLEADGDSTTVSKAIHAGKFSEILDKTFKVWLRRAGYIKLLSDGTDTYITPDMIAGRYDSDDLPALRKAYAHELQEDLGECKDREQAEKMYTVGTARFNAFLDKVDAEKGDAVFWFEKWAPLASRAGYVIMRNNQIVAHMLMVMS